jgi:hypothetical protein
MKRTPLSITFFIEQLQQNKPFSFARFGDGEFMPVFGSYGKNADGVMLDKGLGKQLKAVLRANKPYYKGLLRIALTHYKPQIEAQYNHINWHNGDMLLHEIIAGNGLPLLKELRQKRILYVGPKHCRSVSKLFSYETYIEVEGSSAHKNSKVEEILTAVRKYNIEVIGYSCGPASNIWIDRIYGNVEVTQIDFGSVFDGFFGVNSRSYQKEIDFDKLLKLYKI